ncbi:4'-phosphopantetheinyl transferase family protein [Rhodohalobacter sulfatireducens]|uniref:4'-phosphopantetheinyl transferase superfamily protein n=1 Tax=Rhodohalobacter sulfatireducens TaxID=2911366 RepID=A0ABS9KIX5_9BACT|nr:4'-phosphopantetheinyl transferase superfamily protein [Rhodohalobacter sulfatireducens]MCG2590815.1 4'-phosphopantetheinyl transferase superfamily protein [Rhodohalobacter sulfatireducens]
MKLSNNNVHIWVVDTNCKALPNYLSAAEMKRWNNFYFTQGKQTFYQSHNALRLILSQYLSEKPSELEFQLTSFGKPFIKNSRIQFNLSHSDSMAVIAVTEDAEIGVDIESLDRKVEYDDLAKRYFCEKEYQKLLQVSTSQKRYAFFNCWTRKEAFIKALGDGLSYPLNDFEVTFLSNEPVQINRIKNNIEAQKQWTLDNKSLDNYNIATAVKRQNSSFEYLMF